MNKTISSIPGGRVYGNYPSNIESILNMLKTDIRSSIQLQFNVITASSNLSFISAIIRNATTIKSNANPLSVSKWCWLPGVSSHQSLHILISYVFSMQTTCYRLKSFQSEDFRQKSLQFTSWFVHLQKTLGWRANSTRLPWHSAKTLSDWLPRSAARLRRCLERCIGLQQNNGTAETQRATSFA